MDINVYRTVLNERKQLTLQKTGILTIGELEEADCGPEMIVSILQDGFGLCDVADEYFYLFGLNIRNQIVGIFEVSHGGNCNSLVPIREIFQKTLLMGAVNIIVAHNHPSGYTDPSELDKEITERIVKAGEILDITLLDHIIIGSETPYFSFCETGLINA